jgi:hypothetical protein
MDGLLERPDFTEARSITDLYLVRRFLERESGKSSMDEAGVF